MELSITSPRAQSGGSQSAKKLSLPDTAFAQDFNEPLVHQTVVSYLAGARQGSAKQKTRAEVQGGGRKPWRQKGSGRARAGSIRNPIWRGGGVAFASRPRRHGQKLNRKMYRGAMRCIFSELIRQRRLLVVDGFAVDSHKTSALLKKLGEYRSPPGAQGAKGAQGGQGSQGSSQQSLKQGLQQNQRLLIVTEAAERNLALASRNLHQVAVLQPPTLDPVSLIDADRVMLTLPALKQVEEMLS